MHAISSAAPAPELKRPSRRSVSETVSSLPGATAQIWPVSGFEALTAENFDVLGQSGAELVIFGSGKRLRFPKPHWLQTLVGQGIGLETMDTAAACRTYNILASEGRKVVLAVLLES